MRLTQSVNEHGSKPLAGRRQRRIGMTMLVAGVIVLVAAFVPTSANAQVAGASLVPSAPASFNLNCTDNNDPTTATILQGIPGLLPLILPATISTNAVPDPGNGNPLTLNVTWGFTLPASLVAIAQSTGNTTLIQSDSTLTMSATSGATGTSAPVDPGPTTVNLPGPTDPAVDVPFQSDPVTVTFTRSGTGDVVLAPVSTTVTSTAGSIPLLLRCTPTGTVTPLTLAVQAGPPPSSTTSTVSTLPAISTTTTVARSPGGGTGTGTGTSGTSTGAAPTVTRSTALARTGGFHAELLYLGIALLGAGYMLSLAGRRVARAAARSR